MLKCWHTYTPRWVVCFAGWSLWWLIPVAQLANPVTAKCPEPLCPMSALPRWGRRLAPPRKALPFLPCSYGLMRQAFTLLPISGFALIRKVFAGCCQPLLRKGPSQRYSADLSSDAWTPTAVADRVHLPVSSPVTSAFPKWPVGRLYHNIRSTTSERVWFRGCSHSIIFRPPSLLATQIVPTAGIQSWRQGGRGVASEQNAVRCLAAHRMLLAVRIGQLTAEVFHLLDLQPCWLLRSFRDTVFRLPLATTRCAHLRAPLFGSRARNGLWRQLHVSASIPHRRPRNQV